MNNHSQLPTTSLQSQFVSWSSYLTSHQYGNLFFLKNTGLLPRILQFADHYRHSTKRQLTIIDIDSELVADPHSFQNALHSVKNDLILIVHEHFTQPDAQPLELILQNYYHVSAHPILIVHECAPHEILANPHHAPVLYINPTIYQLPQDLATLKNYVANVCKLWDVKLSPSQIETILHYCGNIPWLINEAIRLASSQHQNNLTQLLQSSPSLKSRMNRVFTDLPVAHHNTLLNPTTADPNMLFELQRAGFLDAKGQTTGEWLQEQISLSNRQLLTLTPDTVIFCNRDISLNFTSGERQLLTLANNVENQIYSRETCAQAIYKNSNPDFTDWSLSQAISRVRTKLKTYQLPITISPKRGQGYVISRN